ncbi:MAG: HD-GYP domain-containing protein [Terriglobales bacterium]
MSSISVAHDLSFDSPVLRLKELHERSCRMQEAVVCAFNQILDLKDLNTGVHSTRLAEWGLRLGRQLGMDDDELRDLELAALVHDIGKVGIPDAILRKPGRLTDEDRMLMNKHPEYGWAILRVIPGFERTSLLTLHHHEQFDGCGYPGGLRGGEIPLGSRIIAVIDAFDAMISNRPYRQGLPVAEAVRRLLAAKGTQFDPVVVDGFIPMCTAESSAVFAATGTSVTALL